MTRAPWIIALASLLFAGAAGAQAPAYGRDPADTLRYHELRTATIRTEGGAEPTEHRRDAQLVLWFTHGDTARARYQRLEMLDESEMGRERAEIPGTVMRGRFALLVSPDGRVRTLEVPRFPEEAGTDWDTIPEWQFADFLPRLPRTSLTPGAEWTDADTFDVESRAGPRLRWTRSTRYRVVRDTVAAGRAAVVVQTEADVAMLYETKHWALLRADLQGTERGRFVFATDAGVLIRRERTGTLRGRVRLNQAGQPRRDLEQTQEYSVTVALTGDAPR